MKMLYVLIIVWVAVIAVFAIENETITSSAVVSVESQNSTMPSIVPIVSTLSSVVSTESQNSTSSSSEEVDADDDDDDDGYEERRIGGKRKTRRPTKRTRHPIIRTTTKRPKKCKQSILSHLTKSCRKGCLIKCARKSASRGRCEICKDKCCEATCHGFECIPFNQINEALNIGLLIIDKFTPKVVTSTQGGGYTEAPPADYELEATEEPGEIETEK
uniref:Stigma-specific STIG1-like protein 1 n=1 Tax=Panagrellus redivivus TaxID=6233 RepID=A0A7E4W207_PANRE